MKATCSSETSADYQRTTWRYIPEYRDPQLNDEFYFVQIREQEKNNHSQLIEMALSLWGGT
jgi:hypothetical protein